MIIRIKLVSFLKLITMFIKNLLKHYNSLWEKKMLKPYGGTLYRGQVKIVNLYIKMLKVKDRK